MNALYLTASLDPKPNFSFYMTPKHRQVEMTGFRLENLAPELIPLGAKLNYDYQTACSCAWFYGLEAYYEVFGLMSVRVVSSFSKDLVLGEWKNISLPSQFIIP